MSGDLHTTVSISIHTLRMEGDMYVDPISMHSGISIHTLRMEGDLEFSALMSLSRDFNPHPPHGG